MNAYERSMMIHFHGHVDYMYPNSLGLQTAYKTDNSPIVKEKAQSLAAMLTVLDYGGCYATACAELCSGPLYAAHVFGTAPTMDIIHKYFSGTVGTYIDMSVDSFKLLEACLYSELGCHPDVEGKDRAVRRANAMASCAQPVGLYFIAMSLVKARRLVDQDDKKVWSSTKAGLVADYDTLVSNKALNGEEPAMPLRTWDALHALYQAILACCIKYDKKAPAEKDELVAAGA